jgi:hypothetical protein
MRTKRHIVIIAAVLAALSSSLCAADGPRHTISLNGTWDFEQSEKAFVPKEFTRKAPVPGLISLAEPKIEGYETLFFRPDKVEYSRQHNLLESKRKPLYNWYRRTVFVHKELEGTCAVVTLLKSQYVTNVFVNGIDAGTSIACFTPIEFPVTDALKFGQDNEILVRVGDRAFLPSGAAGGTDKEKANYIPGIWDDAELSFTGKMRIWRTLLLPKVFEKKVAVKLLVRSFHPAQTTYGGLMEDLCRMAVNIYQKQGGIEKACGEKEFKAKRDSLTEIAIDVPMADANLWTPDDPFLYTARISLYNGQEISDAVDVNFGMRDFGRKGKHFTLNGKKIYLRGTNITLHRFFEDPDCRVLPWDRQWVKKLLSDIPKELGWNSMRICVGIAPKFWYDIADQSGLLLQNEWMYWQNHGWDEQIRAEYTDWVWADGSHPGIVIWDAINENWDPFIGNTLIPELKNLDDTRIWDAGYMTSDDMALDEMDEPHPYTTWSGEPNFSDFMLKNPYPLGDLDYRPENLLSWINSSSAQLVNEYGWMWLWRDGQPAKLTVPNYNFYLDKNASNEQRRNLQAYWLQLETEWLRGERAFAGVLAFCYLTNNYGFTGDWFIGDIKDLRPGPTLAWFRHCFAPAAVFINLTDERYAKHVPPHQDGSELIFNLVGINDEPNDVIGQVAVKLLDAAGKKVAENNVEISIPACGKCYVPTKLQLPKQSGGYLLLAEFKQAGIDVPSPVISRRYIKVGKKDTYDYYEYQPQPLKY